MGNRLSQVNAIDEKFVASAPGKKHICVIGAGSSGLVVMKELTKLGHKVTCFESLPAIGGVYVKSYQNTILTTSSLLTAWSDHSDGKEDQPKFWTAEEYIQYMNNFADKFDLFKKIRFSHDVLMVKKCKESGKWMVTVKGGRGCSAIERCETILEDPLAEPYTLSFDGIAICTGTNTFAANLNFPGQDRFNGEKMYRDASPHCLLFTVSGTPFLSTTGELVHSQFYRCPDRFVGKRVLVIGSGESGSDITNEISKVASKCAISIRGLHGHLIPRIQGNGRVTDLNTNRVRYSNPYIFGSYIGYVNQQAKR